MLVPGRPFQPSLIFMGKAGAFLCEAPFRYSTVGKDVPGTNTLAYLKTTKAKVLAPGRPFQPNLIFVGKAGAFLLVLGKV